MKRVSSNRIWISAPRDIASIQLQSPAIPTELLKAGSCRYPGLEPMDPQIFKSDALPAELIGLLFSSILID